MGKTPVESMEPGALKRGLHILNVLRRHAGVAMRVADIATATGIPRPSVYRLLEILEEARYVKRDASGRLFESCSPDGEAQAEWAAFVSRMDPVMQRIAARSGNPVYLCRQDGTWLECLHRRPGSWPIWPASLPVGGRQPLGVGAAGVALLSAMSEPQRAVTITRNSTEYPAYGNLRPSTVQHFVQTCHERGYAVASGYSLRGITAVGILLKSAPLPFTGALSVTGPVDAMPAGRQRELVHIVREELAGLAA